MKTTTLPFKYSKNLPRVRFALLLVPLALVCFALAPQARGTCQEGCLLNANTALGDDALSQNTGSANTATGFEALFSNTTGANNVATGGGALYSNSTGSNNTATGSGALAISAASDNTATGYSTLSFNTTGARNVASGAYALYSNQTGIDNTATGFNALYFNTANYNTAHGYKALEKNTTGSANTATGLNALNKNTTGNANAANGASALYSNTNGIDNTADGYNALYSNTGGYNNAANGYAALYKNTSGAVNTAVGSSALYNNSTGGNNIALGYQAGFNLTTGSLNIDIGNTGVAAEANTIRIGTVGSHTNTYLAGVSGVTVAGGVGVIVDSNGHLGTVTSSARYKEKIKPMDKSSEAILALKPVTFRYKHDLDPAGITQFGLVAEDVEKVNPDLVARDEQGKPYTVRYEAVNAMLLNEFLKEHSHVQKQDAIIARQQKQIEALTAGLQKVSAQLELSKATPRTVGNQ